jgi:hypothetical protein
MRKLVAITGCIIIALLIAIVPSCKKDDLSDIDCSTIPASYNTDIKPLISSNCNTSGCHDASSSHGNFTTYLGLKLEADNGKLNQTVIIEKSMPPSGPLSLEDRKKIKCWLNQGAPNN